MSIFFKGEEVEAVLFSPLEGQLTYKGKPAAGAKIKLWIAWKDKQGETEYFSADEQGYFKLPKKTVVYRDSPLAQIVIVQELYVEYQANSYLIWSLSKTKTGEFSELGGKPIGFRCELEDELETIRTDDVLMGTACQWDSIEK